MKLTDKRYSNQIFKRVSFCNSGIAVWWTKKRFERCQFLGCDFSDVLARGCRFIECVFNGGKLQHFSMGGRTLVLLQKTVYMGCTFENVKLRSLGIADFIGCTFINCDFNTTFIAASFSKCRFIGTVHGCVFCGPKFDSYYYGDKLLLLSDKPFYCKIKLGSIPFAGVDPFRLLWFRQKSKTTDAQK